jgi:two-component system, cell cycle sensor histidine kinase and response regulator CckA
MHVNVLVVDDDPACVAQMHETLSDMGYVVTVANDAHEAMSYLQSDSACDVVITDVVMPGMWGTSLASWCEATRPELPVVFFSDDVRGIAHVMERGELALTKPVRRSRLQQTLASALARRSTSSRVVGA